MNWKDAPHLFANGKFKVKYEGLIVPLHVDVLSSLGVKFWDGEIHMGLIIEISKCTLIARKIEDMTDEEVKEMYSIPGNSVESLKQMRDFTEMKANNGNLKFSEAIYLLSIGVYPLDQSHFEDGTVIEANLSKPTQHTEK